MTDGAATTADASDAALRGPAAILGAGVLCAALSAVPAIPAVRAVLRVGPLDVGVALGAFWLVMIAGAFVYRAGKDSAAYRAFDKIETAFIQLVVLSLAFRSGRGDSFFWLLAIVHMMIIGGYGTHERYNILVFTVMPVLLAAAHAVTGKLGAAALSLVIGALGVYVYWIALGVSRKLAAADAERARLAAELAETRVREDRQRIARDIHDGVAADLAALDWRLRGLRADTHLGGEVDELLARLGHGSAELRTIVWALRTPSRTWPDVVAYLRQRATELCGDSLALELVDEGDGGIAERTGEVALDFMRAVLEMVRNAVRHAGAARLRVVLRSDASGLSAMVEDDGRGLPPSVLERDEGGLANLRHRVARVGGALAATTPARGGTQLRVQLPA
jgi:signal transduction histidine kinase